MNKHEERARAFYTQGYLDYSRYGALRHHHRHPYYGEYTSGFRAAKRLHEGEPKKPPLWKRLINKIFNLF